MDEPVDSVSPVKSAEATEDSATVAITLNGIANEQAQTTTTTTNGSDDDPNSDDVDAAIEKEDEEKEDDEKEDDDSVEGPTNANSLDGIPDLEDDTSCNTQSTLVSLTERFTTIDYADLQNDGHYGPLMDELDSSRTLSSVPDDENSSSKLSRDGEAEEQIDDKVVGDTDGDAGEKNAAETPESVEPKVDDKDVGVPNGNMTPAQHSGGDQEEESRDLGSEASPSPQNPLGADDIDDDDDDEDEDAMVMDEDALNGAESSEDGNDAQVHAISDSEGEEVSPQNDKVEQMEVDAEVSEKNGVDDDRPVSIGSDSEDPVTEEPEIQKNGLDKPTVDTAKPIVKQEEEEEDCVVIEDDVTVDLSPRRSVRSRKSVLKPRDMFDEDIEEITDDPLTSQPAAKKLKTESPPKMAITIQDARTLAAALSSNSLLRTKDESPKKESSLTITNANSIMGRSNAASVLALQNQNISVRPVSATHQSPTVFPNNIQASITPVNLTKAPQNNNNNNNVTSPSSQTRPQSNAVTSPPAPLLPALTDDMFVLEAPSFIVPYIYEKPPADNLREIVETIRQELADQKKQEDVEVAEQEAKELEAMSAEQRKLAELARAADANKKKSSKKKKPVKSADDSWGESDTSTDDETSDAEQRTKVLIKEADTDMDAIKTQIQADGTVITTAGVKRDNYFESPLGKFFMDIAINLVQEHVQTDLLRQQKKRLRREGESAAPSVQMAIKSLTKNLEHSKGKNQIFKFQTKRCEFCNFKSESALAMAHHYEAPHLNGQMYKCNFCPFEARPPYDILFHMEAIHNVKARLEKALTYHQCPNCPFEDNGKSKLARHALVCVKKFRPEINLNPPLDWEPPAKIPRIKPRHGLVGTATAYQAMAAQALRSANNAAVMLQRQNAAIANAAAAAVQAQMRGRGRPQTLAKTSPAGSVMRNNMQTQQQQQQQLLLNRTLTGLSMQNAGFQLNAAGQFVQSTGSKSSKASQQPSISITPLPRQSTTSSANMNSVSMAQMQAAAAAVKPPSAAANMKPGQHPTAGSKTSFVICEICDGYIKDLDQLRNHMQWMHKVKIHPKMIYNRPPLNCQKCQFRFFTDQGLERHLLGSHGLVTSSMQEAANKGKDSGRCPVCGRMYQWKLLNHVSRDHNMTLKPAHLSYKCTVCTATFGMYKQFENHVYSAHSNVAKKSSDVKSKGATSKSSASGSSSSSSSNHVNAGDSLLKPLKINDEITIIPQPAHSRQSRGGGGGGSGSAGTGSSSKMDTQVIEIL